MVEQKLNNKERAKFHIVLDQDTFNLIEQCKEVYLKHHPEEEGRHLTNKHITKQAYLYYINTPW